MNPPDPVTAAESPQALAELNRWLGTLDAGQRVAWALTTLAGAHALSSSFGAQSAVAVHLVTRQQPDIPVILVDTGYLFAQTHQFAAGLRQRLALNLRVYLPRPSDAWNQAQVDALRDLGNDGLARYNQVHKVEPMQRALRELGVRTWFTGVRRAQSASRANLDFIELHDGRWKLHPLADWSDRDIGRYLQRHALPYHPLWDAGYVSIGDTHSTRRWEPGMRAEDTRFFGIRRECGLHAAWGEESGQAA